MFQLIFNSNQLTLKSILKFSFLTLVFVMSSCKKEEVGFSENPYNYVGEQHNAKLSAFQAQHSSDLEAIQLPLDKEDFIADKIFGTNNNGPQKFKTAKTSLGLSPEQALAEYDFTNFDALLDLMNLSNDMKTQVASTLEKLMQLNGKTPDGNQKIHTAVRALEITLMTTYEDEAKYSLVMSYLATIKYSADYWQNEEALAGIPWWKVVLADAAGAGLGTLSGDDAVPLGATFSAAVK